MDLNFNNINFYVKTFGCQMNKHDSERICGMLEALGASEVHSIEKSDIVIYMTCCVREAADTRLYGQVASIKNIKLRNDSPLDKRIVAVGGCIGQRDGEQLIKQINNVNIVFGTFNLGNLPSLIKYTINNGKNCVEVLNQSSEFPTELPTKRQNFWSAWLPITIGCNNFCSYCIVPYVRGREKSRKFSDILEEAQKYKDQGVKEITLLGQNVNSYGRDLYETPKFYELLCAIDKIGFERIRFATSHPKDISDDVISAFSELKNLQPALHLPLQSGSDRILHMMNRKYTSKHYLDLIYKLRQACPNIALSTDIIVGFPGETDEDFKQTFELVKNVGFHQVFTFIYSKRAGTPAAKIHDNTPKKTIQKRFNELVNMVSDKAFELNQLDKDCIVDVLFEGISKKNQNMLVGKSPKNQTVHVPLNNKKTNNVIGNILPVKIDKAKTWYLLGHFH